MLIRRCAWHPQFHGYPFVHGVASWRGRSIIFTDGVCRRCAARVRTEWELGKVWDDRPGFLSSWWQRLSVRGLAFAGAGACAAVVLVFSVRSLSERPVLRDRASVRKVPVAVARITLEAAAATGAMIPSAEEPSPPPAPPSASVSASHPAAVKAPASRTGLVVRRAAQAVVARIPLRPPRRSALPAPDVAAEPVRPASVVVAPPPSPAALAPAKTVAAAPSPSRPAVPTTVSRASASDELSRSAVSQAAVRLLLKTERPAPPHAGSTVQAP